MKYVLVLLMMTMSFGVMAQEKTHQCSEASGKWKVKSIKKGADQSKLIDSKTCLYFQNKSSAKKECDEINKANKPDKPKRVWVCEPGGRVVKKTIEEANGCAHCTRADTKSEANKLCKSNKVKEYFVCDPTTLEGVSVGQLSKEQVKEKESEGTKLYTSATKAKKDESCKVIKTDSYVCVLNKKNKRKEVKVKSGKNAPTVGAKYIKVGSLMASLEEAKADSTCEAGSVESPKFFVCDPSSEGAVTIIDAKSEKKAKKKAGKKAVVYTTEQLAKDNWKKDCKSESLSCYFCDPISGDIITVDSGFAEGWDKLVAKGVTCSNIKRRDLKKIITKPVYLNLEKLFNDAGKYYSKGVGAKISGNGKKLFKKVDNAPLLSSSEEAKSVYSQVGTHEINKCVPIKKLDCNEKYGLDIGEKSIGDNFASVEDAITEINKLNKNLISSKPKIDGNKVELIVVDEMGNKCGWVASVKPTEVKNFCKGKASNDEYLKLESSCKAATGNFNKDTCGCDMSLSLGLNYDSCEYEFEESSFDNKRSLYLAKDGRDNKIIEGGRTGTFNDAKTKVSEMVQKVATAVNSGFNCTFEVMGIASNTDVHPECRKYHKAGESDKVANQTIADKRAEFASKYLNTEISSKITNKSSCKQGDICGYVGDVKKKANSSNALPDQGFTATVSCEANL